MHPKCFKIEIIIIVIILIIITYLTRVNPSSEAVINRVPWATKKLTVKGKNKYNRSTIRKI